MHRLLVSAFPIVGYISIMVVVVIIFIVIVFTRFIIFLLVTAFIIVNVDAIFIIVIFSCRYYHCYFYKRIIVLIAVVFIVPGLEYLLTVIKPLFIHICVCISINILSYA